MIYKTLLFGRVVQMDERKTIIYVCIAIGLGLLLGKIPDLRPEPQTAVTDMTIKPIEALEESGWLVEGAGDSSYNGVYLPAGDGTYYAYDGPGGTRYLFYYIELEGVHENWELSATLGMEGAYYGRNLVELPANPWHSLTGTSTPPTVSEYTNECTITIENLHGLPNPVDSGEPFAVAFIASCSNGHPLSTQIVRGTLRWPGGPVLCSPSGDNITIDNDTGEEVPIPVVVKVECTEGAKASGYYTQVIKPADKVTIDSITDDVEVESGATVSLSVSATDNLGHELYYAWSVAGEEFNEPSAVWTPPENETDEDIVYTASVTVTCAEGASATGSVNITVTPLHEITLEVSAPASVESGQPAYIAASASCTLNHQISLRFNLGNKTYGEWGAFGDAEGGYNSNVLYNYTGAPIEVVIGTVEASCTDISVSENVTVTVLPSTSTAASPITWIAPQEGATVSGIEDISFSIEHEHIIETITVYVNEDVVYQDHPNSNSFIHIISKFDWDEVVSDENWLSREEEYAWITVVVEDDTGETYEWQTYVVVEPTPVGSVTILDPVDGQQFTVEEGDNLELTVVVDSDTAETVTVILDGEVISVIEEQPVDGIWNIDISEPVDDGEHTITVIVEKGDHASEASVDIVVNEAEASAPQVTITSPLEGGTICFMAMAEMVAHITSSNSTIAYVQFYLGNSLLATYTESTSYVGPVTKNGDIYTCTIWQYIPPGTHDLTVVATDENGQSGSHTIQVIGEQMEPAIYLSTIAITGPTSGQQIYDDFQFNFETTIVNEHYFANICCYVDGALIREFVPHPGQNLFSCIVPVSGLSLGLHTAEVIGIFPNGSTTNDTVTFEIMVEEDLPPTIEIVSPANYTTFIGEEDINIAVAASDDGSIQEVRLLLDGALIAIMTQERSGYYRYITTASSISNGTHTLTAIARDNNDNEAVDAISFHVEETSKAPVVIITNPVTTVTADTTIDCAIISAESIATVTFYVDGTEIDKQAGTAETNYTTALTAANYSNGYHTISVIAADVWGFRGENTISVLFDVEEIDNPPTVSITSHISGTEVSGSITVEATATDDDAVKWVSFSLDGYFISRDWSGESDIFSCPLNTRLFVNGSHVLSVIACDTHNQTTTDSITLVINNVPPIDERPTVAIVSPTDREIIDNDIDVEIIATDDDAVESVKVYLDGNYLGEADSGVEDAYSFKIYEDEIENGIHTIGACAQDTSGQTTWAHRTIIARSIIVDAPPVVTITRPSNGERVGSFVVITAEAQDNGVLGSLTISVNGQVVKSITPSGRTSTITHLHRFTKRGYHVIGATATEANTQSSSAYVSVFAGAEGVVSGADYFSVAAVASGAESIDLPEVIGDPPCLLPPPLVATARVGSTGIEFAGNDPTLMADGSSPVQNALYYLLYKREAGATCGNWALADLALSPLLSDADFENNLLYAYDCKSLLPPITTGEKTYDSLRSIAHKSAVAASYDLPVDADTFINNVNISTNYNALDYLLISKEERGGSYREHYALLSIPVSKLEELCNAGDLYRTVASAGLTVYINDACDEDVMVEVFQIDAFTESTVVYSDIDLSALTPVLIQEIAAGSTSATLDLRTIIQSAVDEDFTDVYVLIRAQSEGWLSVGSCESNNPPSLSLFTVISDAPSAINDLIVEDLSAAGNYKVKLQWSNSTADNLRCYNIYRSDDFMPATLIGTTTGCVYYDTSIAVDGEYIYYITAVGTAHHEYDGETVVSCMSPASNNVLVGFHEVRTDPSVISKDTYVYDLSPDNNYDGALLALGANEHMLLDIDVTAEPIVSAPDIRSTQLHLTPVSAAGSYWVQCYDITVEWDEETATYNTITKSELRDLSWSNFGICIIDIPSLCRRIESGEQYGVWLSSSGSGTFESSEGNNKPYLVVKYSFVDNNPDLTKYDIQDIQLLHANGVLQVEAAVQTLSAPSHVAHKVYVENVQRNDFYPTLPDPTTISNPLSQTEYNAIKSPGDGNAFVLSCKNTSDIPCLLATFDVSSSLPAEVAGSGGGDYYPQQASTLLEEIPTKEIDDTVIGIRVLWRGNVSATEDIDAQSHMARMAVWNNVDQQWFVPPQDCYNIEESEALVYLHLQGNISELVTDGRIHVIIYPNRCNQRIDLSLSTDYIGMIVEVAKQSTEGVCTISAGTSTIYVGINSAAYSEGEVSDELNKAELLCERLFTESPSLSVSAALSDGTPVNASIAPHGSFPQNIAVITIAPNEEEVTIHWQANGR
jgi:hypothetical protein